MSKLILSNEYVINENIANSFVFPFERGYLCLNRYPAFGDDKSKQCRVVVKDKNMNFKRYYYLNFTTPNIYDIRLFPYKDYYILTGSFAYTQFGLASSVFYHVEIDKHGTIKFCQELFQSTKSMGEISKNLIMYNDYIFYDFSCNHILHYPSLHTAYKSDHTIHEGLRGGSNIIRVNDELITFCHDFYYNDNGKRVYNGYEVHLDINFPHTVTKISKMNVDPYIYGNIPLGRYPNNVHFARTLESVVFPSSCWLANGMVNVSIGVNEVATIVQTYEIEENENGDCSKSNKISSVSDNHKSFSYQGSTFHYRQGTTDETVLDEIFKKDIYNLPFHIDRPPVIVDIGAHIGLFCLFAAKKYPRSKIYAYEPQKNNFELLTRNIKENNLPVELFNKGISGKKENTDLFISTDDQHTAGHSILSTCMGDGTKENICCDTLKNIIAENNIDKIDLLKIDCEGAEFYIFETVSKEDLQRINNIVMEYHEFEDSKYRFKDIIKTLEENEFELVFNTIAYQTKLFTCGTAVFIKSKLLEENKNEEDIL